MTEAPLPLVLALVLADDVRRDPATGKFGILGTFNRIRAARFPCQRAAAVYVSAIGGRGTVPVTVRLVDVDEERPPIFSCDSALHFPDPTQPIELALMLHGLVFPQPGDYRVQFCAAAQLLRELRLRVEVSTGPRPHEDAN